MVRPAGVLRPYPETAARDVAEEAEETGLVPETEDESDALEGNGFDLTQIPAQAEGATAATALPSTRPRARMRAAGQATPVKKSAAKKSAAKKAPGKKAPGKKASPPRITTKTVATSPGARTRTTIGVGEEVTLTHTPGSVAWTTTAGTLSAASGASTVLTAPDTAQAVTVTGGTVNQAFTVVAPSGVHMDRFGSTKVRHTKDRPDSGIQTRPFLLPDTVNFYNARYHEVDVGASATGVYAPFNGVGHDASPATVSCSSTVVAGKGTQTNARDSVYSGDPGTAAPFAAGHITFAIPYEFKVGAGSFHSFTTVTQTSTLTAPDALRSSKAGAVGDTTVGAPTSTY